MSPLSTSPVLPHGAAALLPVVFLLPGVIACADQEDPAAGAPTYYADTKAVIDARCASCHAPGEVGPFPLTSYDEVVAFQGAVEASIESGSMPPWQPDDECAEYLGNIDLSDEERALLLEWLAQGAPEGDPADAAEASADGGGGLVDWEADIVVPLPEAYSPTKEPDDYRCQLIEWPAEETRFVTGVRVAPDASAIVHHVIVFYAPPEQVEQFRAYDDAEDGPGYTCYGGPRASSEEIDGSDIDMAALLAALEELGLSLSDLQSGSLTEEQMAALMDELGRGTNSFATLGSWVPGAPALALPEGTGIRIEPGSLLVVQMHYNTLSSEPVADRSVVEIATVDQVEREGTNIPLLDLGWVTNGLFGEPMDIPAGASEVAHSTVAAADSVLFAGARRTLGLTEDDGLVVYSANHHMHELGTTQRSEIHHADGSESCLLDIPDWDFSWQGSYRLAEPVVFGPDDEIWMGCTWDNSAANQPVVDGEVREPADVSWGEGTSDEMCLGGFYVTAE